VVVGISSELQFASLARYAPVDDAARVKAAVLFIVAEKEELFDNKDHAKLAYDRDGRQQQEIRGHSEYYPLWGYLQQRPGHKARYRMVQSIS
jgi:hypothetical protein